MQGIALLQQHPFVHEIHLHLACVHKQKLLAQVFLERGVAELVRRLDQKRQQAALPDLAGEGCIARPLPIAYQGLTFAMAHQAVAALAGLLFSEQLFDIDVQCPCEL
ncbi:hypothetical protein D3C80_1516780 [compost metagenome]